ncbi:MAG TPA: hypothetical protein VI521_02180 [Candidatus Babeliales bacterium]|nr:hypothetical protein [Candidatus Babeliales bacterium]
MKYIQHVVIWAFLSLGTLYAKDIRVRSADALRKKLAQAPYSLVLFYDNSRELKKRDAAARESIDDMEILFRSLSNDAHYKDAQLQFVRAETNRNELQSAIKSYDLSQLPAWVIFLDRQKQAVAYGNLFRDDVEQFIAMNLKNKMKETIKQADELRKKRLEEAKIQAYSRPYWYGPYWAGGGLYPYWWYGNGFPYGWYW